MTGSWSLESRCKIAAAEAHRFNAALTGDVSIFLFIPPHFFANFDSSILWLSLALLQPQHSGFVLTTGQLLVL